LLLLLIGFNLTSWLAGKFPWDRFHFFVDLMGILGLFTIWYLNRKGYTWLAGVLLICLFMIRTGLIMDPARFTSFYWIFSLPIILSSFILAPVYSFPSALVATLLYYVVKEYLQITEDPVLSGMKVIGLFILAAFSFFTARYLDKALEEVKLSEIKFHTLFNNLPIGLYRTAPDGRIMDVNPAFLQMFGFPNAAAALKMNAASLYADPSSRQHYLSIAEGSQKAEIQMRRLNGEQFWVNDHVSAIRNDAGEVQYYEGSLVDITSRVEAQIDLEYLAVTDPLTGMFNRRQFFVESERIFKTVKTSKSDLAVMMIDIDYFKRINDQNGHAAGDAVLCEVARRLQGTLRSLDTACRYGGDEFTILFSRVRAGDISRIAGRLQKTLTNGVIDAAGKEIRITVSMGIAQMPGHAANMDILLQRADKALYAAKHAGRNRWVVWTTNLPDG
jgi:diguanylate cyclase (GGDEF)-like protein/PAS domain S-box-containing protein